MKDTMELQWTSERFHVSLSSANHKTSRGSLSPLEDHDGTFAPEVIGRFVALGYCWSPKSQKDSVAVNDSRL